MTTTEKLNTEHLIEIPRPAGVVYGQMRYDGNIVIRAAVIRRLDTGPKAGTWAPAPLWRRYDGAEPSIQWYATTGDLVLVYDATTDKIRYYDAEAVDGKLTRRNTPLSPTPKIRWASAKARTALTAWLKNGVGNPPSEIVGGWTETEYIRLRNLAEVGLGQELLVKYGDRPVAAVLPELIQTPEQMYVLIERGGSRRLATCPDDALLIPWEEARAMTRALWDERNASPF